MAYQSNICGLWLPLITPFKHGKLDESSLRRLIRHYTKKSINGIILAATTGEGQTLSDEELEQLVAISANEIGKGNRKISLFLGVSGSDPRKIQEHFVRVRNWPIDGYLISGPNYLRPSQEGLRQFYEVLANSTQRPILIYNIPYRTGVNIENETMRKLAAMPNVKGVKDCSGNAEQSFELLRNCPSDFAILTGEDPFFYNALVHGAAGAIVTGAHILADIQLEILADIQNGQQKSALHKWNKIAHIPKLLFAEPSPAPIKYWLWRLNLIDSAEVRLPMVGISDQLAKAIDEAIEIGF